MLTMLTFKDLSSVVSVEWSARKPDCWGTIILLILRKCLGQANQSVYMRKSGLTTWGHPISQKEWPCYPQSDPTTRGKYDMRHVNARHQDEVKWIQR